MPIRPQCSRIAATYYKEAAYGTAVLDANIDKWFTPTEPIFVSTTREYVDDSEFIKGHEFAEDVSRNVLISQDVQVPFSFQISTELFGLLAAFAFGAETPTGAGPYVHTYTAADLCTVAQFPSTSWVLGMIGDTASYQKVKGAIVNDLSVSCDSQGYVTVSGTLYTDGTITPVPSFTWPGSRVAETMLTGTMADFLTADAGSGLVSKKAKLRSFTFGINNNLDVGDARTLIAAAGVYLSSLRTGNREYTLEVSVEGHPGDEFWTDWVADTEKDVEVRLDYSASEYISFRAKSALISNVTPSFDGIRDVLTITYKFFYNSTDNSPVIVTVGNTVPAYLLT